MTLTPSDVASLSDSLSHWDVGEYISEGLVILACAGELVADLGRTCLPRRVKARIERWSTMLLVAALIAALICLQRTNHLSGLLIGSLKDKAAAADQKAQSAIDKSGIAETKAAGADAKSDAANTASAKAQDKANAARREADSFEKDIITAKKQAADAESHLADALERANAAEQQSERLTNRMADRILTPEEQTTIASQLLKYGPRKYDMVIVGSTSEIVRLAAQVARTLFQAKWTSGNAGFSLGAAASGIFVATMKGSPPETEEAASSLIEALRGAGLNADRGASYEDKSLPGAVSGDRAWDVQNTAPIRIIIGAKP